MQRLLQAKHRRLHQLLRRGIVHSSLVIELHRQELEFVQATHKNELEALMTLFRVRAIDGAMFPDQIRKYPLKDDPEDEDQDANEPAKDTNEGAATKEAEAKNTNTEKPKEETQ